MDRLNKELEDLIDNLKPYEFDKDFFDIALDSFDDPKRTIMAMIELHDRGYLHWKEVNKEDGSVDTLFYLSTDARHYRDSLRRDRLAKCLDVLKSFIIGASGGLVVFLLSLFKQ